MGDLTPRRKAICVTLSASLYQALVAVALALRGSSQKRPRRRGVKNVAAFRFGCAVKRHKWLPAHLPNSRRVAFGRKHPASNVPAATQATP